MYLRDFKGVPEVSGGFKGVLVVYKEHQELSGGLVVLHRASVDFKGSQGLSRVIPRGLRLIKGRSMGLHGVFQGVYGVSGALHKFSRSFSGVPRLF